MKKKLTWAQFKQFIPLYVMMLPSLIYIFINNYIPMAGIVVAFKKYNVNDGMFGSAWCGLNNFKFLFGTSDAFIMLRNTLCYNVAFIIINQIMNLVLAIMISDVIYKGLKKLYQSCILLPFLISMVVVSYIVFAFLSQENGMFNGILKSMGKAPYMWYQQTKPWPLILILVNCWKGVGYGALIYIAGIAGIDPAFYEAAELDGANKWQQITKITIPCLLPQMITLIIMSVGRIFASDFGLFYQVPQNSGTLFPVTQTIDTYVYRALISAGGIGRSSAAGVFQSIVGFVLVMVANGVVRKVSSENAMF